MQLQVLGKATVCNGTWSNQENETCLQRFNTNTSASSNAEQRLSAMCTVCLMPPSSNLLQANLHRDHRGGKHGQYHVASRNSKQAKTIFKSLSQGPRWNPEFAENVCSRHTLCVMRPSSDLPQENLEGDRRGGRHGLVGG